MLHHLGDFPQLYKNAGYVTFAAGSNSYGNPFIRWSTNNDTNDMTVEVDGIFMEPGVDFTKSGANTITFMEAPGQDAKIVVHGLNLLLIQNRLDIYKDGTLVEGAVTKIDFRGSAVTVTKPATGEVRVTVTAGSGGASFVFPRTNNTGSDIPVGRAVCFGPNGTVFLADNTIPGRKNPKAITIEPITNGFAGLVQYGGLMENIITGMGFTWDDEVFLGLDGQLVNEANIPNTGSPLDEIIKVGDVSGTAALPTDIIWCKEAVGGF